jgi:hypothetical protein
MRCMVCGAEMRVMQVVPDETMAVPGYERHTLQCSDCGDVEQRLVFSREKTPVDSVPTPPVAPVAPESVAPGSKPEREHVAAESKPDNERVAAESKPDSERVAAPSAWARAFAMFRGRPTDKGS